MKTEKFIGIRFLKYRCNECGKIIKGQRKWDEVKLMWYCHDPLHICKDCLEASIGRWMALLKEGKITIEKFEQMAEEKGYLPPIVQSVKLNYEMYLKPKPRKLKNGFGAESQKRSEEELLKLGWIDEQGNPTSLCPENLAKILKKNKESS